ncbi:MAG: ABC transporter substrate-binding protein [Turicibacter sp.]|nr:ABC transporter substrate-binding protein [Turicibacter sp.]
MKRFNKYVSLVSVFLLALMVMVGCGNDDAPTTEAFDIEDPLGLTVTVPVEVEAIVSLTPAITGVLVDLGLTPYIVAVDGHSIFLFDDLSDDVLIVDSFNIEIESIIALDPDLVIAHDMIMMGDLENDPLQPLRDLDIAVAYLPAAANIEDISRDIHFLGTLTRREEAATDLEADFQQELSDIAETVATSDRSPIVYFEISPAPDMFTFGHSTFQHELLERAGAINVFADQEGWLPIGAENVVEANPEVIFTNASFMDDPVGEIMQRSGWEAVDAISNERVYYIDNNASSIPNHHIVIALRMMVEHLHGE